MTLNDLLFDEIRYFVDVLKSDQLSEEVQLFVDGTWKSYEDNADSNDKSCKKDSTSSPCGSPNREVGYYCFNLVVLVWAHIIYDSFFLIYFLGVNG